MSQRPSLQDLRRVRNHIKTILTRRQTHLDKTHGEVARLSSELRAIDDGITYQERREARKPKA